ncbi:MAG: hypothetical protein ACRDGQ_10305 [Candidatus Limnocylindrales bacterium]
MTGPLVSVPRVVIERALVKAEIEYQRKRHEHGLASPWEDHRYECWAEFEALAEAAGFDLDDWRPCRR